MLYISFVLNGLSSSGFNVNLYISYITITHSKVKNNEIVNLAKGFSLVNSWEIKSRSVTIFTIF